MPIKCEQCGEEYPTDQYEIIEEYEDSSGRRIYVLRCPKVKDHKIEISASNFEKEEEKEEEEKKKEEERKKERKATFAELASNIRNRLPSLFVVFLIGVALMYIFGRPSILVGIIFLILHTLIPSVDEKDFGLHCTFAVAKGLLLIVTAIIFVAIFSDIQILCTIVWLLAYFRAGALTSISNTAGAISTVFRAILAIALAFSVGNLFNAWWPGLIAAGFFLTIPHINFEASKKLKEFFAITSSDKAIDINNYILYANVGISALFLGLAGIFYEPKLAWAFVIAFVSLAAAFILGKKTIAYIVGGAGILAFFIISIAINPLIGGIWLFIIALGIFTPPEMKPGTGLAVLAIAGPIGTIEIAKIGEIGKSAFGPWWPQVYQFGSSVFGPIGTAFSQLQQTLGQGWLLLTNPVGYAQQMMSGVYATDPLSGLAGAYGVEIQKFEISPIYPGQPFFVTISFKNMGAFDGKNVNVYLDTATKNLTIEDFNFDTNQDYIENLMRQDSRQTLFTGNLSCAKINEKGMRKIPLKFNVSLSYDYSIDSELSLEFLSSSEWDRLVSAGQLVTQQKKPATLTNAPVKLNIDSPQQPIREGSPFFIGLALVPARDGKIYSVESIELSIPSAFKLKSCTPSSENYIWKNLQQPYVIYCQFEPLTGTTEAPLPPTQTFLIKASANYRFQTTKDATATIEFGGGCCSDAECPKDYRCEGATDRVGNCVPKSS
jgi:hypothetical protein